VAVRYLTREEERFFKALHAWHRAVRPPEPPRTSLRADPHPAARRGGSGDRDQQLQLDLIERRGE